MLHRTEEEENAVLSSIGPAAPTVAASQQDTVLTEPVRAETERLVACIEVGITRKKRRLKTARYICFANNIAGFLLFVTLLRFAKAHPILIFGGAFINSLVNTINERICKG